MVNLIMFIDKIIFQVKFRIRPKKRGGRVYTLVLGKDNEEAKIEQDQQKTEEEQKSDVDVETAIKQIRKGWSIYDAGDLTIGDLYLMVRLLYFVDFFISFL